MKKIITTIIAACFVLCAAACSTAAVATTSANASWEGTWTTSDGFLSAQITNNLITIDVVDQKNEETSLYWKGTWDNHASFDKGTVITSEADVEALSYSILGSQDSSKKFTWDGKQLTLKLSMLGTTKIMRLEKN